MPQLYGTFLLCFIAAAVYRRAESCDEKSAEALQSFEEEPT